MQKIKIIILLIIIFNSLSSWASESFILDTNNFIKNQPIIDSAISASTTYQSVDNDTSINNPNAEKVTPLSNIYCPNKQRRGIVMQKEDSQNYIGVRGGLMFKHTNCKNGNIGQIRIKRRDIKATYQIKF